IFFSLYRHISIFFFQAEDGIRDRNVTGVQTCALPISLNRIARVNRSMVNDLGREPTPEELAQKTGVPARKVRLILESSRKPLSRSEERRVGKEWRGGGGTGE